MNESNEFILNIISEALNEHDIDHELDIPSECIWIDDVESGTTRSISIHECEN